MCEVRHVLFMSNCIGGLNVFIRTSALVKIVTVLVCRCTCRRSLTILGHFYWGHVLWRLLSKVHTRESGHHNLLDARLYAGHQGGFIKLWGVLLSYRKSDPALVTVSTQRQLCFFDSEEYKWKKTYSGNWNEFYRGQPSIFQVRFFIWLTKFVREVLSILPGAMPRSMNGCSGFSSSAMTLKRTMSFFSKLKPPGVHLMDLFAVNEHSKIMNKLYSCLVTYWIIVVILHCNLIEFMGTWL